MYTKHGIVEDYRFFLHAFVIFEIAKLGCSCRQISGSFCADKWLFLRPRQAAIFTWAVWVRGRFFDPLINNIKKD